MKRPSVLDVLCLLFVPSLATAQFDVLRTTAAADKLCVRCSLSADGSRVAFDSLASKLVESDTNNAYDVFVWEAATGQTIRVSVASDGTQGNGQSWRVALSGDGLHVAFQSDASNLVAGDTNGFNDIFVHDVDTGLTERISVAADGAEANGNSWQPAISTNGRYVAFQSDASNLVLGDTNAASDIFLYDRQERTLEMISKGGNKGSYRPTISAYGRFVAYVSDADNLVPNDKNNTSDAFVRDRLMRTTVCASVSQSGTPSVGGAASGVVSGDGLLVAFHSGGSDIVAGDANNKMDVFVRDLANGTTELVSRSWDGAQGNDNSRWPALSFDGRYVSFESDAANLAAGDTNGKTDAFVHDRRTSATECISASSAGVAGDKSSFAPAVSEDGRMFALESDATNLVEGDTGGLRDIFRIDTRPTEVSGSIGFDGLAGAMPSQVFLDVRHGGSVRPFGGEDVALDDQGVFTIRVPRGPVDISLKQTHWLRRSAPAESAVLSLINGDATGNNRIDLVDLSAIFVDYGSTTPTDFTDLDESGMVDVKDISIVFLNYGAVGDP